MPTRGFEVATAHSRLIRFSVLFGVILIVCGCHSPTPPVSNAQNDAALLKLMATTPHKADALSWIGKNDDKTYSIGDSSENLSPADSLQLLRDLKSAGAMRVVAIDTETDSVHETTSTFIIELSTLPDARKKVFQIDARVAKTTAFDPTRDTGQKYLMLHW